MVRRYPRCATSTSRPSRARLLPSVGSTGSGKSTLINLIPRFYDVDSGSILIDGVDVRDMSQKDLRSRIGLVPQKAVLFSGSVAENIRYGNESASETEVTEAADTAQAIEFISEMNEGYDSVIAQGGTNVSGGQKQRLSIARALVRKPEIYLYSTTVSPPSTSRPMRSLGRR